MTMTFDLLLYLWAPLSVIYALIRLFSKSTYPEIVKVPPQEALRSREKFKEWHRELKKKENKLLNVVANINVIWLFLGLFSGESKMFLLLLLVLLLSSLMKNIAFRHHPINEDRPWTITDTLISVTKNAVRIIAASIIFYRHMDEVFNFIWGFICSL